MIERITTAVRHSNFVAVLEFHKHIAVSTLRASPIWSETNIQTENAIVMQVVDGKNLFFASCSLTSGWHV